MYFGEDSAEKLGLVGALHALHQCGDPLDSHAAVDIGVFQGHILALGGLVVLHEDVVPDFHPFAAAAGRAAFRSAVGLVHGDEHLGVRPAGAGLSGWSPPVVLLAQEVNICFGDAQLAPDIGGLFVPGGIFIAGEASDLDLILVKAQHASEELEAHGYGLLLEVVSQRPVAQHFEKGEVEGVADLVDIAGAQAFLHVHQAFAGGMLFAQQIGHQRMHAGGGKQAGGIIFRNQGRALDLGMCVTLEKLYVLPTQFGCGDCFPHELYLI